MIKSTPETQFAIDAVKQASELVQKVQSEVGSSQLTKGDQSPVTVGDFAGQAVIGYHLSKLFPKDTVVAEESSDLLCLPEGKPILQNVTEIVSRFLKDATLVSVCQWIDQGRGEPQGRFWTLDPIDGTKGFLRGDQYVVAIALIESGQVRLGVLGCPNLEPDGQRKKQGVGSLVIAVQGEGAWISPLKGSLDFKPLKVSPCDDPKQMRVLVSVETSHTNMNRTETFFKELGIKASPIQMDSQVKYAVLATGGGELFFYLLPQSRPQYRMKIWDVAPGAIVIEEAEGRISDLEGKPIDYQAGIALENNPGLLVSNGHLHPFALEALSRIQ